MNLKHLLYTALAVLLVPPPSLLPGGSSSHHQLASAGIPIPIDGKGCTIDTFDPRDANVSAEALIAHFGGEDNDEHAMVRHRMVYGEPRGTAIVYVCNCKDCVGQTYAESETREVLQIVREDCGPGRGGWVWSNQWEKGWGVRSAAVIGGPNTGLRNLCPFTCIGEIWEAGIECEWRTAGIGTSSS